MKSILLLLNTFFLLTVFGVNISNAQGCSNDPPPEIIPCDVTPICGFNALDNYCIKMESTSNEYSWPDDLPGCYAHDPNWFAFVAGTNMVELEFLVSNCISNEGIQLTIFEGDPVCNGPNNTPTGLSFVGGRCSGTPYGAGTHNISFNTTPGRTYYVLLDGWNGDLCYLEVDVIQGGDPPQITEETEPDQINIPEFAGPDTICVGAQDFQLCATDFPSGSAFSLWEFPDGTFFKSDIGQQCITVPASYMDEPGEFEFCVAAANDCDTTAFRCRTYIVANPSPTYTEADICEGDTYSWVTSDGVITIGPPETDIDGGELQFTELVNTATADCQREENLTLRIQNVNDEDPIEVDGAICFGEVFSFKGYQTSTAVEDIEHVEEMDYPVCDSIYEITVDVIGFDVFWTDPVCDGAGNLLVVGQAAQAAGTNININDPDLTTSVEWVELNSGDIVSTEFDFTISQDMLEMYPNGRYRLTMEVDYPGLENPCVYESTVLEISADNWLPSISEIVGPDTICVGSEGTFDAITIEIVGDPVVLYTWNFTGTNFEVLDNGLPEPTLVLNEGATPGEFCVEILTGCGFTASLCKFVEVSDIPTPDAGPDDVVCGQTYDLVATSSASGNWTVVSGPGMANFSQPGSQATEVNVDAFGLYEFAFTAGRPGCEKSDTVLITFAEGPQLDGTIAYTCINSNTEYTAEFQITGGTPPYIINSGGGTIDGSGLYTSDPIASGTNQTIVITDQNGCGPLEIDLTRLCNCDTDAGMMETDLIEVCEGDTVQGLHISGSENLEGDDATQYVLHDRMGGVLGMVFAINDTGEFTFQAGMTAGQTYYISLIAGNDDGSGSVDQSDGCLSVAPGQPVVWYAIPTADAGPDLTECESTVALQGEPDVGVGTWTQVSGPGSSTFSNANDPNTDVTVTQKGVYRYLWTLDNEGCTDTASVEVEFYPDVTLLNTLYECDATKENYRVTIIVDAGATPITEGDGKGTISEDTLFTDWIPADDLDTFRIFDANGCGPLVVPVEGVCDCESAVGTMASGMLSACTPDGCVTASYDATGENQDNNDTGMYVLHDNAGGTLGTILDQNQTGEFCYDGSLTAGQTYYISYVVGNENGSGEVDITDPCLAVSAGQAVVFYAAPTAEAGVDTTSCGTEFSLTATYSTGSAGTWQLTSQPSGSSMVDILTPNSESTEVRVDIPGEYCFEWTEDNAGCTDTDAVCVEVQDYPILLAGSDTLWCDDTGENYFVRFEITGGDLSTAMVTGDAGTLSGTVFTSEAIPAGTMYQFLISDGNDCGETELTGTFDCDCLTEAGDMDTAPLIACEDEEITVDYDATGENQDGNDGRQYLLVDDTDTELIRQDNATFSFDGGILNLGEEYEIRVIVGNSMGGDVDRMDDCLAETAGVPVTWIGYPVVDIVTSGDSITCEQTEIELDGSGSTPSTNVSYTWSTSDGSINPDDLNAPRARVTSGGTYRLVVTTEAGGCSSEATVTIEESEDIPTLEIAEPQVLNCRRDSLTLDASASDQGSNYTMAWTTTDGQILGDATGYTVVVGSAGTYSATLTDNVNGCEVTRVVTVTEDRELPEVVIGSPEEITCTRSMVILSSEGSSTGTEYDYQWMTDNGEISGGSTGTTVSVTSAGDYTLIITNTENGCVDSTSVSVEENENVVTGVRYTQSGLLCEGSQLATLSFTAEGGVSPYEYRLGEETNGSGVFTDLESGEYTVNVEDANGCVYDSTFMIEDPEDFSAELGGPVQVNEGDSALVTVTYGQDIDVSQIIWETETGEEFSCLNAVCDSIRFEPSRTQILRVIVISSNGCQREDIVQVVVLKDRAVYVPSGFSPNDDGTNDVFLPYGGEKVAGFNYMFITDRWGEKVYEVPAFGRIDEVRGWDGRYNGEKMQPGVYIYETEVVYEDGETKILKGDVTLLR